MKMTCEQLTFKNKSIKKSKNILNYTKKVIKTGWYWHKNKLVNGTEQTEIH